MSDQPTRSIAVRLRPGADLRKEIIDIGARECVRAGCILTCVGSLSKARLRFAGKPDYVELTQDLEIVSLVGTLGPDGPHLHLTISDETGRTLGGHMGDGCIVRTTAEVIIGVLPGMTFRRVADDQTGHRELLIESENRTN